MRKRPAAVAVMERDGDEQVEEVPLEDGEEQVEQSVEQAEGHEEALRKWEVTKKRAGYCGLCRGVLRDFRGQVSRRQRCKQCPDSRSLTPDEQSRLET